MKVNARAMTLVIGSVAVLGAAGTIRAEPIRDSVTYSAVTPSIQTNFGGTTGVSPQLLNLPKFDPAPGSYLERVELTFWASITSQVTMRFYVENTIIRAAVPDAVITVVDPVHGQTLTVGGAGDLDLVFLDSVGMVGPISPTNPIVRVQTPQTITGYAPNASEDNPLTYDAPSDLAFFTGPGSFVLPVSAEAASLYTSSTGSGGATIRTTALGGATVTYYYVVPEPSSLALLGLGAGGALVALRRRGHKAV